MGRPGVKMVKGIRVAKKNMIFHTIME